MHVSKQSSLVRMTLGPSCSPFYQSSSFLCDSNAHTHTHTQTRSSSSGGSSSEGNKVKEID